jgi:hypothetical protein
MMSRSRYNASSNITFHVVSGPGRIWTTHNGDPANDHPRDVSWVPAYHGLARACDIRAFPCYARSILAEIYLRHTCSGAFETEDMETPGQVRAHHRRRGDAALASAAAAGHRPGIRAGRQRLHLDSRRGRGHRHPGGGPRPCAVSRAFPSCTWSILAEKFTHATPVLITKLRMETPGQGQALHPGEHQSGAPPSGDSRVGSLRAWRRHQGATAQNYRQRKTSHHYFCNLPVSRAAYGHC